MARDAVKHFDFQWYEPAHYRKLQTIYTYKNKVFEKTYHPVILSTLNSFLSDFSNSKTIYVIEIVDLNILQKCAWFWLIHYKKLQCREIVPFERNQKDHNKNLIYFLSVESVNIKLLISESVVGRCPECYVNLVRFTLELIIFDV